MSKRKRRKDERAFHHRLVLKDRGDVHRHRWQPTCPCGWVGVPGMTAWAEQQYRDHVASTEAAYRTGTRGTRPTWRRVTPDDKLPASLRERETPPSL